MQNRVVPRAIAHRPVLAVSRYRHIDELGTDGHDAFVIEPEPVHHAGPKVLHEDIALPREIERHRLSGRVFQVDGDALLVAVEPDEEGAARRLPVLVEPAHVVAGDRVLDLDDRRPQVGKLLGREGSRDDAREIEDLHALQGRRCVGH